MATAAKELDDYRWWRVGMVDGKEPKNADEKKQASKDRAKVLTALIRKLRDDQRKWIEEDLLHMSLYEGRRIMGFGLDGYWQADDESGQEGGKIAKNLVRKYVNAVVAKIGKNRPRPFFQTEEGNFDLQEQGEGMQRYVDGLFYEADIYEKDLKWLQHTATMGLSHLKVYRTDDPTDEESEPGIAVDVVLPGSLTVNPLEAIDGTTRNIYQRYYVDKDVLAELYPDHAEEILDVDPPKDVDLGYWQRSNQVLVSEAWHLPSGPKAKDGRHMLVLDDIPLIDERYKRDRFPFVPLRYDDDILGYRGTGLAYQLFGYQSAINKRLIQEENANHLLGNPKVLTSREAQVDFDAYTNEVATQVEYNASGGAPSVMGAQLFPPEFYAHLERLNQWAAEDVNISPMMSQGEKPPGITAAAALEALMDQDTEHFAKLGRRWEQGHMDIAEHMIELAQEIHEGDEELGYVAKDYPVTWRGSDDIKQIEWGKVNLKANQYHLKVAPTSQMPTSVAARLEMGSQLKAEGGMSEDEFLEMMNMGADLGRIVKQKTAARRYLEKTASSLKKGKWISPEPDDNLQMAVTFMTQALQEAKFENIPDDRLQLFRDYLLAVKQLMSPPPAPPGATPEQPGGQPPPQGAAPPGMPPGAPPGPPGAPPMPPMPAGPPPGAAMN